MAREDPAVINGTSDGEIRKRCMRRLGGLQEIRKPYEDEAREIASYTMPARSRFLSTRRDKGRQPNKRLNNSQGIFAFRTLQGGMTSGLSSESRPWFTLEPAAEEFKEDPEITGYLGTCEKRMYQFLALTNFYGAAKTGYLEMGGFGTEACVAVQHPDAGMVCHALTFGEYWIGLNDASQPGALYRDCGMSVLQAVQQFGKAVGQRVMSMYDASQYETTVEFYHAIEENPDFEEGRIGVVGKPWRSVYWDKNAVGDGSLLQISGYDEQPFWAPRWDTTGGDTWGQGPGHDALPDLRELQLAAKRKGEAIDFNVHPEMVVSTKAKLKRQPRSVVSIGAVDDVSKLVSVPYEVPYQTIQMIREDINELVQAIQQATYADLFMAITNMQGVQPRNIEEIAARNEEKLTQLGPVIERVNNEKLKIAIERVFGIMQRARLLPPAPEKLRGNPEIKIEFVSILTQMQRMVGLGQIERGVSFVGSLTAMYPGVRHKLDAMEIVDEYWSRAGAPAKLLRPTEEAEANADQEQNAQQMAGIAEQAANLGKPIKDVTEAAKVAADVPASGIPPTQDLIPVVPR